MGACLCGLPRVKKIAADNFYETFAYSLFLLHQSIRQSVVTISKDRSFANDIEFDNFFAYCKMSIDFLEAHHVGEDKYVFPFMTTASHDQSLMEKESGEHKALEQTIIDVNKLIKDAQKKQNLQDIANQIKKHFVGIGEVLLGEEGHLKREETKFTSANFKKWNITEKALHVMNDEMHSIIPQYMNRMEGLIFIIYHLNDEEKAFWDERIPCIVTKMSFPSKANERFGMWSLAPYRRLNKNKDKCTWYQE